MKKFLQRAWRKIKSQASDVKVIATELVFPSIRPTEVMWLDCELDKEPAKIKEIEAVISTITKNIEKYKTASKAVGVPVWVIAGIHFRESSLDFKANMVNGQPLWMRTTIVPKGLGPWPDWESACIDAFKRRKYDPTWSIPEWLDFCEKYNGLGYRRRGLTTPYVWAYTNQSAERGKFVRDGVFDPSHRVRRPGIAAILEYAIENNLNHIVGPQ